MWYCLSEGSESGVIRQQCRRQTEGEGLDIWIV